jgi:hypothetical protein
MKQVVAAENMLVKMKLAVVVMSILVVKIAVAANILMLN